MTSRSSTPLAPALFSGISASLLCIPPHPIDRCAFQYAVFFSPRQQVFKLVQAFFRLGRWHASPSCWQSPDRAYPEYSLFLLAFSFRQSFFLHLHADYNITDINLLTGLDFNGYYVTSMLIIDGYLIPLSRHSCGGPLLNINHYELEKFMEMRVKEALDEARQDAMAREILRSRPKKTE